MGGRASVLVEIVICFGGVVHRLAHLSVDLLEVACCSVVSFTPRSISHITQS
jgi:hypothetical protein